MQVGAVHAVHRIINSLKSAGYTDTIFIINGIEIKHRFANDIYESVGYFLHLPTYPFTLIVSHPKFKVRFYKASISSGLVCDTEPFGCMRRSVVKPIIAEIKNYHTKHQHELELSLFLQYSSIQYRALSMIQEAIMECGINTKWAKTMQIVDDSAPFRFDDFMNLFDIFSSTDFKALVKFQRKNKCAEFDKLITIITVLNKISPLSPHPSLIPIMFPEGSHRNTPNKKVIRLPSECKALLGVDLYSYDGLAQEHNTLLTHEKIKQAPNEITLSDEQYALIEQLISFGTHKHLPIKERLELVKLNWLMQKNEARKNTQAKGAAQPEK